MLGNSFSILYSALLSDFKAMDIRNRNISNANNPSYVKEEPILETLVGVGGVKVSDIRRISDEILQAQLLEAKSGYSAFDELNKLVEALSPYFEETSGVSLQDYINNFFQSLHDFLREPTNRAAKLNLLTKADLLAKILESRYSLLDQIEGEILKKIPDVINGINKITESLAKLNKEIAFEYARTYGNSKDYKYLLDQRDKFLSELSQYVNINYKFDSIGRVEVSVVENDSTAAGFIQLVSFEGNNYTFSFVKDRGNPANSLVVDQNGTMWRLSFFQSGRLGAYSQAIKFYEGLKEKLNALATNLADVNNLYLSLTGTTKAIFRGTSAGDIAVNITAGDLNQYDVTRAQNDAQSADSAWQKAKEDLQTLQASYANGKTEVRIKFETERDLYDYLHTQYTQKVGVNLDEELAEVMKLQRHYQAVSKMIATSSRLLDYLLNSLG
ncbi:MAG TPA: flagellar hook-associated protein FlgK [Aquifex aeolicus]|uniref:Flagellar hook-associated protein 1 n=1 Tax=Aquifex aeolicus TaxID=63363 RepID=A0A9D1CFL4_AQUAO|nr:flagellar hook-associated protein FlgK [Aquificales bacterium]HIP98561.1 flagellar hook-associated protein FlgK [Aquifex aeolicus]HIQ26700.1 flagellar hook-associated protein FlgK [Aquifex aeolicus]